MKQLFIKFSEKYFLFETNFGRLPFLNILNYYKNIIFNIEHGDDNI